MRTDGNEYLIYLVGYQEKQVVSYIRKLYKEFKNLPYEHGAAIGYSMITNDMKTIEATKRGKKCLVIDKRPNIAGNIYTEKQENINTI